MSVLAAVLPWYDGREVAERQARSERLATATHVALERSRLAREQVLRAYEAAERELRRR